jgi:D-alanyl-D-alanine carboxypeptidase/D-alanyl-D-alanine-endopeptidase (penicillin-binding protein 4)
MMKNSNNLYAESVFYQLGLMRGRPSTAKKACKAIEDVLRRAGREESIHRFADGSGLSLYNYVSADIEVAFLRYAFSDKDLYYKLYETLPIAAIDGTLKDRMNGTPAAGNVRAKTGTVSGVSSLAGYCTTSGGRHLAFSIINQGVMKGSYAKALQDRLCVEMCK